MKKILIASLLAAAIPLSASAADGTINFTGNITDTTCAIGSAGSTSQAVTLPFVTAASLATAGATAGFSPFNVQLVNCPTGASTVRLEFNSMTNVDATTGRLTNRAPDANATATPPVPAPAANVQIALRNGTGAQAPELRLGSGAQSTAVTVTNRTATIPLTANYVATAAATAGPVQSSVQFSITYE